MTETHRILLAGFALPILALAGACGSPPDTEPRSELAELYEFLYDEAEAQFGRDLRTSETEADDLARLRLLNAANSLADSVATNPRSSYEIDLPYLNIPEEEPGWDTQFGFEVTLTAEQLAELGVSPPQRQTTPSQNRQ